MASPKYLFAVFGDPKPPEKDKLESGIYHPDPKYAPFSIQIGDIMLLYCTAGYEEYPMMAPGIGVVLSTNDNVIQYRYLPLSKPVYKDAIEKGFDQNDATKFGLIRFSSHWLKEISKESFARVIGERLILWP